MQFVQLSDGTIVNLAHIRKIAPCNERWHLFFVAHNDFFVVLDKTDFDTIRLAIEKVGLL